MEDPVNQADNLFRWVRLLYMILFAILYKVSEFVMWIVVVFQAAVTLVTGSPNERAQRFGKQLSIYVYSLWMYLTYNTEKKPFPYSDWPVLAAAPPRGIDVE